MAIFLNKTEYRKTALSMKVKRFTVEVADSFMKIMRGLMDRERLPADGGMLFVFKRDRKYGFWMLNMKFGIDIIWLDKNYRVVYVWRNAMPCKSIFSCRTVKPDEDSRYVLEVRAGTASALRLRIGDRIRIGNSC